MSERRTPASRAAVPARRNGRGLDDLGLRRALGDRMLPLLVGAMAFLAALALAGAIAAAALAGRWQEGAIAAVTVQVPHGDGPIARRADGPEETRLDAVLRTLRASPDVAGARVLGADELATLLRPWLGAAAGNTALPLPSVVAVQLAAGAGTETLSADLSAVAPGTLTEAHGVWVYRLSALARSLQACAWVALLVVVLVAAAVVMVATRAGLASRRDAIEIVHGLGATDGYIAARFAGRITRLAGVGGLLGAIAAIPVLAGLVDLAAPFTATDAAHDPLAALMLGLPIWLSLPALPLAAAAIGFLTAQATVRSWLRKLP
jgi:cell division transport system permease protein